MYALNPKPSTPNPSLVNVVVEFKTLGCNTGAVIIRAGFGGILYYNYRKEPPRPIPIIKAPKP